VEALGQTPPAARDTILVRPALSADLAVIRAIYAHHVLDGTASFEEVAPDEAEMRRRWDKAASLGLPYLAAEHRGVVAGYAYAGFFRERSAYRYTLEDSVYVAAEMAGRGIGTALLRELLDRCERLGYRRMVAVIGDSANTASIALHRRLGFEQAGLLRSVGFKFGRWIDSVYMSRALGPGDSTPAGR
jgi:L-amino acid N-acyltransferase YncA